MRFLSVKPRNVITVVMAVLSLVLFRAVLSLADDRQAAFALALAVALMLAAALRVRSPATEDRSTDTDADAFDAEVSEWVGQHYAKHFPSLSETDRADFRFRFNHARSAR